jgi:hypothetical protein
MEDMDAKRLGIITVKFWLGGGVGVMVGYLTGLGINALGEPYAVAAGVGYAAGAVANLAAQIKLGTLRI